MSEPPALSSLREIFEPTARYEAIASEKRKVVLVNDLRGISLHDGIIIYFSSQESVQCLPSCPGKSAQW